MELTETLGSAAFLEFMAEYEAFVSTPGMAARPVPVDGPSLVRHRMPATIWTDYAALWAFDQDFTGASLTTLHQARIAGKWLRYSLEFVRAPLEPDGVRARPDGSWPSRIISATSTTSTSRPSSPGPTLPTRPWTCTGPSAWRSAASSVASTIAWRACRRPSVRPGAR